MPITIKPARGDADLETAKTLFRAYAAWLDIDLSFQDFEAELATLPGKYAPPKGEIFLAWTGSVEPAGCIAVRPFDRPGACEVKRLFVREIARAHLYVMRGSTTA